MTLSWEHIHSERQLWQQRERSSGNPIRLGRGDAAGAEILRSLRAF
ncbi:MULTISPECIES: hypothetical protein [unclassified Nodosilinea]|uniref:Uncharacterized protein n=1 Tax=Leptolyngbya subtilissima DQ-A4 TaxID=2933933 RepID=A0ABV0KB66_9CYAN|nr:MULTISPECIES: hypothetical protein [unclassified Nodosilinea]MBD2106301.1 hypothetical protein [Nodosilinea sp. FACHB-13]MBD2114904.1 hypothetical protein [Nodosilinea sp. FACHB-141]